MEKVFDGGSGGKKLWVAENLEVNARSVKRQLSRVSAISSSHEQPPLSLTVSCTSCAVRHGTVDFSTMMAPGRAC